jgi:hypothetical protein
VAKLDFHDVFLEEKEEVLHIFKEQQETLKAFALITINFMVKEGVREVTVNRPEFTKMLKENDLSEEPIFSFRGNGEYLTISLDNPQ